MENLENSTMIINPNRDTESPLRIVGYTLGATEVGPEDDSCYAKKVFDPGTGNNAYYVKKSNMGNDAGSFINPNGIYYMPDQNKRKESRYGKSRFTFTRVNETSFNFYVQFLKTGNISWLRNAERAN